MPRRATAAHTARDLGAKKVILVAPYLAYMRQDKRFHPGEAISSRIMAKLLNGCVDKVITIDTHLHRYKSLKEIFTISAANLTANHLIAQYIHSKIKDPLIIGPDWESYQWAESVANVSSKMIKPVAIAGKDVVIIDDIISTGHTIAEAAKKARKMGAKSITAIGVHGLLVEGAMGKMKKAGVDRVVTSNCIEHATNGIDVTPVLLAELKR